MKSILPLAALCAATAAHAVEPFVTYDNFRGPTLSADRWDSLERTSVIRRGALNLAFRAGGKLASDTGLTSLNFNQSFHDVSAITAIRAKITVNSVEPASCAANPVVTRSRARIAGSFFNVGVSTPGSQFDDVVAQVRLNRASNSTDPVGVLRVEAFVSRCTSADCASSAQLGTFLDFGTINLGQAATVQMEWDQATKSFLFSRDGAAPGVVTYTEADTSPPSVPFKNLSLRLDLPNCQSGPQAVGAIDASFDNVAVNQSAAP